MKYLLIIIQLFIGNAIFAQNVSRTIVPGMKCSMEIDDNFKLAKRFTGFEHVSLDASILVSVLPNSIDKNIKSIESDNMKNRGILILNKSEVKIASGVATLFELNQESKNVKLRKYFLVFGDSAKTVFIDAMAPDSNAILCSTLRRIILSTNYDENMVEDPFSPLEYFVQLDTSIFKVAKNSSKGAVFTNNVGLSPAYLSFSISSQTLKVKPADEKGYAEEKLKGLNGTDSIISFAMLPVIIDNLKGFVMECSAINKLKKTTYNYQVFLYGENNISYIMMGRSMNSMEASRKTFEPIAKSFKLK